MRSRFQKVSDDAEKDSWVSGQDEAASIYRGSFRKRSHPSESSLDVQERRAPAPGESRKLDARKPMIERCDQCPFLL
jgi:hypothetical protein